MYAVIKTGGKQHKVQAGDVIEVEKLVGPDETVTFTPLLVVDDDGKTHAGPAASKATVTAKPLAITFSPTAFGCTPSGWSIPAPTQTMEKPIPNDRLFH